jgi:beta-glucosidase
VVTVSSQLPPGTNLAYGVATAAFQVEGATRADGRGLSIWDTFAARSGTIRDGSDGSVACASYDRLDEDLDLVAGLGVGYYRFSVAWPRVQPAGSGSVEPRGLAYYDRLVDGLLERDVAPLPTLYHWDLPQPLEDAGGWPARDTAERFADYAALVHDHLGDRVHLWATLNEPWCAAFLGYAAGIHAPGRREPEAALRAAHHLMLGHGLAAHRLHDAGSEGVGVVLNLAPVWPERLEAAATAREVDGLRNRIWLGPLVDGRYDDELVALAPPLGDPAVVRDGDLDLVRGSADWLGINYYTPARVDTGDATAGGLGDDPAAYPGVQGLVFCPRQPQTGMGWEIEPRGLEELLVDVAQRSGLPLLVSENGAAFDDSDRADDGSVADAERVAYLREHVNAVERARAAGADVRLYVAWTLLDNFEWAEGYTKKFGLVEVDPKDQTRTPKASYRWFSQLAHAGSLRPEV